MNKICLCCGQRIEKNINEEPWHTKCVKSFFETSSLPKIDLGNEFLEKYVTKMIDSGITVTGVQKKLSLHLEGENNDRLTLVDYPGGYILKPPSDEYESLPEYEFCVMHLAKISEIKVVPNGIIEDCFITKRIDRTKGGKLAMEDFCQLSGRTTSEKYKGSYESCGKIIEKYSSMPGVDLADFFLRIVFSFVTGNSDMHYKNFSLIETRPGSREYRLSPAYDLLPVNIILPEDTEETALTLNGKKSNFKRDDFLDFGRRIGLVDKTILGLIKKVCDCKGPYDEVINSMPLKTKQKSSLKELISGRINRINIA